MEKTEASDDVSGGDFSLSQVRVIKGLNVQATRKQIW